LGRLAGQSHECEAKNRKISNNEGNIDINAGKMSAFLKKSKISPQASGGAKKQACLPLNPLVGFLDWRLH